MRGGWDSGKRERVDVLVGGFDLLFVSLTHNIMVAGFLLDQVASIEHPSSLLLKDHEQQQCRHLVIQIIFNKYHYTCILVRDLRLRVLVLLLALGVLRDDDAANLFGRLT